MYRVVTLVVCRVVALVCTGWLHWLCIQGGCTGCAYRMVALVVCRVVHWLCVGWLHWLCVQGSCTGCV